MFLRILRTADTTVHFISMLSTPSNHYIIIIIIILIIVIIIIIIIIKTIGNLPPTLIVAPPAVGDFTRYESG